MTTRSRTSTINIAADDDDAPSSSSSSNTKANARTRSKEEEVTGAVPLAKEAELTGPVAAMKSRRAVEKVIRETKPGDQVEIVTAAAAAEDGDTAVVATSIRPTRSSRRLMAKEGAVTSHVKVDIRRKTASSSSSKEVTNARHEKLAKAAVEAVVAAAAVEATAAKKKFTGIKKKTMQTQSNKPNSNEKGDDDDDKNKNNDEVGDNNDQVDADADDKVDAKEVGRQQDVNVTKGRPRKRRTFDRNCPFPFRLWALLSDSESCNFDHIVSWTKGGEAFVIHDHQHFASQIMNKYFGTSMLRSFSRQLTNWGFTKCSPPGKTLSGPGGCSWKHPFFYKAAKVPTLKKIARKKPPKSCHCRFIKNVDHSDVETSSSSSSRPTSPSSPRQDEDWGGDDDDKVCVGSDAGTRDWTAAAAGVTGVTGVATKPTQQTNPKILKKIVITNMIPINSKKPRLIKIFPRKQSHGGVAVKAKANTGKTTDIIATTMKPIKDFLTPDDDDDNDSAELLETVLRREDSMFTDTNPTVNDSSTFESFGENFRNGTGQGCESKTRKSFYDLTASSASLYAEQSAKQSGPMGVVPCSSFVKKYLIQTQLARSSKNKSNNQQGIIQEDVLADFEDGSSMGMPRLTEAEHTPTPESIRRQAYEAVVCGCSHFYTNTNRQEEDARYTSVQTKKDADSSAVLMSASAPNGSNYCHASKDKILLTTENEDCSVDDILNSLANDYDDGCHLFS